MHELGYILCKLICHLRERDPFLNIAARVDFTTSCTIDFWESVVGKDRRLKQIQVLGPLEPETGRGVSTLNCNEGQLNGHQLEPETP